MRGSGGKGAFPVPPSDDGQQQRDGLTGWVKTEVGPDGKTKFKMIGPCANCYGYSKASNIRSAKRELLAILRGEQQLTSTSAGTGAPACSNGKSIATGFLRGAASGSSESDGRPPFKHVAHKRGRHADGSVEAPAAKRRRCTKLSQEDIIAKLSQRLTELEKAEHEAAHAKEESAAAAAAAVATAAAAAAAAAADEAAAAVATAKVAAVAAAASAAKKAAFQAAEALAGKEARLAASLVDALPCWTPRAERSSHDPVLETDVKGQGPRSSSGIRDTEGGRARGRSSAREIVGGGSSASPSHDSRTMGRSAERATSSLLAFQGPTLLRPWQEKG